MDNMEDYLKWYGELSFEEKKLTEIDNFILCKLAYLIISDINLDERKLFKDVVSEVEEKNGIHGTFYGHENFVTLAAES